LEIIADFEKRPHLANAIDTKRSPVFTGGCFLAAYLNNKTIALENFSNRFHLFIVWNFKISYEIFCPDVCIFPLPIYAAATGKRI